MILQPFKSDTGLCFLLILPPIGIKYTPQPLLRPISPLSDSENDCLESVPQTPLDVTST